MKSALNSMCFVAVVLVALGLCMVGAGFAVSGFNERVFSTEIDARDGVIILGGEEVDPSINLPLLSNIMQRGHDRMSILGTGSF